MKTGLTLPAAIAGVAVAATLLVGIRWNTFAAGGSDSHCYLSQARSFAAGRTVLPEPLAAFARWPPSALAPMGYVPSPVHEAASVGICPAGLSLAMAPLVNVDVATTSAAFLVVPIFGALGVWLTYALGRCLGRIARW